MTTSVQRDVFFRNKFLFVVVLFLVLMGLAHAAAEWAAWSDVQATRTWQDQVQKAGGRGEEPGAQGAVAERPQGHTVMYYRIRFTTWTAAFLVIPAFCFYILRRPVGIPSYWVLFWTAAYLALLARFCWWVFARYAGGSSAFLPNLDGINSGSQGAFWHPIPDLLLVVWWGLDLLLAWAFVLGPISNNPGSVVIERGLLHAFAFIAFLGAAVFAPGAGVVMIVLGVALFLAVVASFGLLIVTRRANPESLSDRLYVGSFAILNRCGLQWHSLPTWLGVLNLGAVRDRLRASNLVGTEDIPVTNAQGRDAVPDPPTAADLRQRNLDGYYNDLRAGKSEMGSASRNTQIATYPADSSEPPPSPSKFDVSNPGARFGRNVPRDATYPEQTRLLDPSPREVSRHLLARDTLKEATILNFLAAAWIQFETHDWFFHGEPNPGNEFQVPLAAEDNWEPQSRAMLIRRTRPDPTRDYAAEQQAAAREGGTARPPPPTYVNSGTHWWDASQIYGDDLITQGRLRTPPGERQVLDQGKLYLDQRNLLPIDPSDPQYRIELTGFNGNWWLGLTLLHTLFVREHNAICDHLHEEYPNWDGERLFQTARLVNAALMAKIHTVEWTPAILPNPALQVAMNANWWGLAGEPIKKVFGRISENEVFSGIIGSAFNHHAADYSLTEEFVSVYRMHPLIRDDLTVYSAVTGLQCDTFRIDEVVGPLGRQRGFQKASITDLFYSFGVCHPGALTLRNFPNFLRDFRRPDGDRVDLAAIDILRDRERGVPRYNQFRHWLHLPRFHSIDQMIDASGQLREDKELARELKRIYNNDIENVDLMVGMLAETPPPLFGFSDTAFRIFILMASRRLKSDRFFTTDFTPDVYSPAGFAWVNDNSMRTILLRHYPELAPALRGVENAFAPWRTIEESRHYDPYEPDLDATDGGTPES